jgi:hypothetical protein
MDCSKQKCLYDIGSVEVNVFLTCIKYDSPENNLFVQRYQKTDDQKADKVTIAGN